MNLYRTIKVRLRSFKERTSKASSSDNAESWYNTSCLYSVAIVGSRKYTNYVMIESTLDALNLTPSCIVSGGAVGMDKLAEQYARNKGIPFKVYLPDWKQFGNKAGLMRNTDIVNCADVVVAFPTRDSRGTYDSINKARKRRIQVYMFYV